MSNSMITPDKVLKAKIKYVGSDRTYEFLVHQYDEDGVMDVYGVFRPWHQVLEIEED
ncbi:MAG: hypothetical protein ABJG42_24555 [Vibrio splendidus]